MSQDGKREEGGMPQVLEARVEYELARAQRDLNEAREQQAATSEILRVISNSPEDLEPVFQAILENATRLCEANFGNMYVRDGDSFRIMAAHNTPAAFVEARKRALYSPGPKTATAAWFRRRQSFMSLISQRSSRMPNAIREQSMPSSSAVFGLF
jgi:hypothetical protein